jgi:hypothetical protein
MTKKAVNWKGKLCLLLLCIAGFICSCATMKKTTEAILFQNSFENTSVAKVYNSCIEIFQIKEIPSLSIDQEAQRISTDWIYFGKPGTSLKYRYRFDLNINESGDNKVDILLKCEYQKGTPVDPNPVNPFVRGIYWKDLSSDTHLENQIDAFLQEIQMCLNERLNQR